VQSLLALYASNALLLVPFIVACYIYRKDARKFVTMVSAYMLLAAVVIGLKFAFRVPRPPGASSVFDPFGFPSFHTAFLAALVWFINPFLALILATVIGILRVLAGVHTWWEVVAGFAIGVCIPPLFVRMRQMLGKEADRQAFHMGAATLLALLLYRLQIYAIPALFLLLGVGVVLYVLRRVGFIHRMLSSYDRAGGWGRGAFTLVLGLLLAALIAPTAAWVAAFYVAYVDGFATLGGKLRKTKRKSVFGFLAGLLGAFLAYACTQGYISPLAIVVAPLVELLTPKRIDDNITLPVAVALLYYI